MTDTPRTQGVDHDAADLDQELDLQPEALKDLVAEPAVADQVAGGATTIGDNCECGTM